MNEKWINKAHSVDANIIDISKPRAPLLQVIIPLEIFYIFKALLLAELSPDFVFLNLFLKSRFVS